MAQFIHFLVFLPIFIAAHQTHQRAPDTVLLDVQEPELKSFDEILGAKATALDFGLGMMKGLYYENTESSKCGDYLNDLREHLKKVMVYLDLQHVEDRGKIELVYELALLQASYSQLMERCSVEEQISSLSSKLSHMSGRSLIYSYIKHNSEINTYLINLLFTCHIDSVLCGQNLSNILKLLTESESECADSIQIALEVDKLVSGMILGLKRPMTQEVCMDSIKILHTDINSIALDLYNVIQLRQFEFIFTLLKDYQVATDHYKTTVLDCPFDELTEILRAIPTVEGMKNLMINMFMNYDVVIKDYQNMKVCRDDWEVCGFSIGEVSRLILKWGI